MSEELVAVLALGEQKRCVASGRCGLIFKCVSWREMKRCRLHLWYSGHVQGVGFRYTTKAIAHGYEVAGLVRNLLDGRVELIAEGSHDELEAFKQAIHDSGLGPLIRHEEVAWEEAQDNLRGFAIVS